MKHHFRSIAVTLALALTLTTPAFAQGTEAEAVVPDVDLTTEVLTRLDSAVATTTRGVEVGAEFTWPILVRQQVIEGAVGIGLWLATVLLFGTFLTGSVRSWGPTNRKGEPEFMYSCTVISAMIVFASTLGVLASHSITRLFNPEYHALMDILGALGLK